VSHRKVRLRVEDGVLNVDAYSSERIRISMVETNGYNRDIP
jgi:hypothetical protein